MLNLAQQYAVPSFEQEVILPDVVSSGFGETIGGWQAGSGELTQGKMRLQSANERILIGDATDILTGTGIFMGNDGAASPGYDFRVGNPSGNYLHWDASAGSLTLVGSLTATSGTIGGFSIGTDYIRDAADTFGLASTVSGSDDVRFWAGAAFASRASAPARITEAGAATFTNVTISGGAISGTPISSIPNNSSTDISLLEKTHTMVFSVTDNNTIAWTSGTITLSNGRTFSINSGNTGNMAALTYIYLDPGVSSTALQTTTTAATAMGANKILLGVAQNNTVTASFIPYGPGQALVDGAQIGALSITAGNIAASTITAGKLSVSQLSAITADLGTITAGTVTGATIRTAASGTRFSMTSTSFQGINSAGTVVFEIVISGGDAGDVIMGDDATTRYAKWDNSAGTFTVNGYVQSSKGTFGGDGSDGALSITSGTTTLSAASARYLVKNYTSISITSTGKLAFSNPHTNGTVIILKSQGGVTITSSATCIDASGMGAAAGTAGYVASVSLDTVNPGSQGNTAFGSGASTGGAGGSGGNKDESLVDLLLNLKQVILATGGGGGAGRQDAGLGAGTVDGGRGGGALLIECGGAWNFTTALGISVKGAVGGESARHSGAGGGAGGTCIVLYNTLTANSGTIAVGGGDGGRGLGNDASDPKGAAGTGGNGTSGSGNGGTGGTSNNTAGGHHASGAGGGASYWATTDGGTGGSHATNGWSGGGGGGGASGYSYVGQNVSFA